MAILEGKVEYLGVNQDSDSPIADPRTWLHADIALGLIGDRHQGFTRPVDVRDRALLEDKDVLPKGVAVRARRQWTGVSLEELTIITSNLNLSDLKPEWIGANLAVSGIERFTELPKGSLLFFPSGATFEVEEENNPCVVAGQGIEQGLSAEGLIVPPKLSSRFVTAAMNRRGLAGSVFRSGKINVGDPIKVQVYEPRSYFL